MIGGTIIEPTPVEVIGKTWLMSLIDLKSVDAIAVDRTSGAVALSILDPWNWEDENHHLSALTEKTNAYLGLIDSEELYDAYPQAVGKRLEILIIGKFQLSSAGARWFEQASSVAQSYGVKLVFQHRP